MAERNLLEETIRALSSHELSYSDVKWVGSTDGRYVVSFETFALMANQTYDAGYGGVEVIQDLVVVGDGWWLERHEYDGSEWWEYKEQPRITEGKPFTGCFVEDYEYSIRELMERKKNG